MLTDGRLGVPPRPSLTEHVLGIELAAQMKGLDEYLQIDLAHVLTLAECGAIAHADAAALLRALLRAAGPNGAAVLDLDPKLGGVLPQVEAYLVRECGPAGGSLQLARSRIDQNGEGARLIARRCALDTLDAVLAYAEALLDASDQHRDVAAPGYTHLQHSQPGTLGHFFNAHYWVAGRSADRLLDALGRIDQSSLGGAALVGTDWPIDRERTARLLGHPSVVPNARDAGIFALDVNAELAGVLALALTGMARLAGDLYFWSSSEVGLVRIDAGLCGTSSMMPQKRNPYALERVRALAGEAVGWPASQLGMLRMATSTDCDLVFVDNHIPVMCAQTAGAAALMADVVSTLEMDVFGLRRSAGEHWGTASALADELVRNAGLSFRTAHGVVARLVRLSETTDASGAELLRAAAREAGVPEETVAAVDLDRVLDVDRFLATRTSLGGCAPQRMAELAEQGRADLARLRAAREAMRERIEAARAELFAAAEAFVSEAERG